MLPNKFSLFLIVATSAIFLHQVESFNLAWPSMPAIRSLMWTRPSPDDLRDTIQAQAAQTQARIAQTQAQIAQSQNNLNEQVKNMYDEVESRVGDNGQTVIEYSGPSQNRRGSVPVTKKKMSVTDEGMTEEMAASYISPDGNARGFAKSSRTVLTNKAK